MNSNGASAGSPVVEPYTAYRGLAHGMTHYYHQLPDCVIHINQDSVLINRLDVDHIRRNMIYQAWEPVHMDEFFGVANFVLKQLGFDAYPTISLLEIRQN